ncbi:hypothetical protein D3C87_2156520 [compost metagenome]
MFLSLALDRRADRGFDVRDRIRGLLIEILAELRDEMDHGFGTGGGLRKGVLSGCDPSAPILRDKPSMAVMGSFC